ncbi:MAG: prepilin-type N-terminal cleavage/methylation domain-containing protein [Oscillospiraceae bacterium]|jgi:prepilin-type N-terminal cleavage/methylation domain-containing protein|nr:prepilin-type N-terminal cleavage/methylation domain-containing protein [Oscillospiraceae bacterium]
MKTIKIVKTLFQRIKNNSGFTLTECMIALTLFTIMTLMLMQLLMFSIQLRTKNVKAAEGIDSQVEDIAAGGSFSFDDIGANSHILFAPAGDGDIIFVDADGNPFTINVILECSVTSPCGMCGLPPDPSCVIETTIDLPVEIAGQIGGFFNEGSPLQITKPQFGAAWDEFGTIVTHNGAPAMKFFSNLDKDAIPHIRQYVCESEGCFNSACQDMAHNNTGIIRWTVDIEYSPPKGNYIIYMILPDDSENIRVGAGMRHCTAHVMSSAAHGTAVRIMNVESDETNCIADACIHDNPLNCIHWARVDVLFAPPEDWATMGGGSLLEHFCSAVNFFSQANPIRLFLGNPANPFDVGDGMNFMFAEAVGTLPSRPGWD